MFDLKKLILEDADFHPAEEKFGFPFNDGQKSYIRFWESTDVQACPGSGKTTSLAGKLILLSKKLPRNYGKGICVITHTNTAIDEIRDKLGPAIKAFGKYPHHFGTVQSFVNKFLAGPYIKAKFKSPIAVVDNFEYRKAIDRMVKGSKYRKDLQKTIFYLGNADIDIADYLFNIHNFEVSATLNTDQQLVIPKLKDPDKIKEHYGNISYIKNNLLAEGILKYDEAYSVGFKYLREYPQILPLFEKRFSIVCVDEMQDMEFHQFKLLDTLFGDKETVFQRIGDINQSIFSTYSKQEKSDWVPKPNPAISLNQSARLSDNIASEVKHVCISPQENLKGWENKKPIKPTILVFNNDSIGRVKDAFGKLIVENELHKTGNGVYKIVGQRRSMVNDKGLNLNSYWSDFQKSAAAKNESFDNLVSYIDKAAVLQSSAQNVKDIRQVLLLGICKALRVAGIRDKQTGKSYTPFGLSHLPDIEETGLSMRLATWITWLPSSEKVQLSMILYIHTLIHFLKEKTAADLSAFLIDAESSFTVKTALTASYPYSKDPPVNISFDTIHAAKGETHCATLYVETSNNGVFDIGGKILDFITSAAKRQASLRTTAAHAAYQKRLPLAYVAMTRASHFLCLAVHEDRWKKEYEEYFKNSEAWDVQVVA